MSGSFAGKVLDRQCDLSRCCQNQDPVRRNQSREFSPNLEIRREKEIEEEKLGGLLEELREVE